MGFWIFMMAIGLLIPAIMIVFGKRFIRSAPKKINFVFGFRTEMSMRSKDTWEFAHKYIGKLWFRLGLILVPITAVPMLFVIGRSEGIVATVGLIVNFVNLIALVVPIFFTEKELNRVFDKDGNRKAA